MPPPAEIVVIGIGNTILSDDGIGVHAARILQQDARVPAGVTVLDGGTLGLGLVSFASGASCLLLLDAMDSGAAPGVMTRLTAGELVGAPQSWTAHDAGVADLISALALVSDAAPECVVLGVQPQTTALGTSLSPAVDAALRPLVDAALAELRRWTQPPDRAVEDP